MNCHFLESSTCAVGIYVIVLQISPRGSEKLTGPAKAHVANKWESSVRSQIFLIQLQTFFFFFIQKGEWPAKYWHN